MNNPSDQSMYELDYTNDIKNETLPMIKGSGHTSSIGEFERFDWMNHNN